ncbi:hypothetical protein [uncultured Treponema sp.]|uniref:hypothetical protein n=1 Tax=uncultured Treponema sp. TaxID=162155 RepID=UPI0025DDA5C7|nr:hypothetical protein [uncultured Treponema sp.]
MKKRILFCLVAMLTFSSIFAQTTIELDNALSLAATKIQQTLPQNAKIAVAQFSSNSKELSNYITTNLEANLKKNGFTIVERNKENLKKLNAEIDYQYDGNVNDSLLVEIGKQVGAHYLVYGNFEQFGTYMSLYVRVTNIETIESPVIETMAIRASAKLNELLGDSRSLQNANDYIEEIARCRTKLLGIQRERDKEIEKTSASIRSKYQEQINAINRQVKDPWDSVAEFEARKKKEISTIESRRDTEINGEKERITIQYNNMTKNVEISEREIKSKLAQTQFKLTGNSQVNAFLGKFDAEAKPKNWPVQIRSLDELVPFTDKTIFAINDADLKTEYLAVTEAQKNNFIAGEITYSVLPHSIDEDFDIKVNNYKVYNSKTGAVYINNTVDKVVRQISSAKSLTKTENKTVMTKTSKKKLNETKLESKPTENKAELDNALLNQMDYSDSAISNGDSTSKYLRVCDIFGINWFLISDSLNYTMNGVSLNAFTTYNGPFYIDWLNIAVAMGKERESFLDATVDVGLYFHLFGPFFIFGKGGIGAYFLKYQGTTNNKHDDMFFRGAVAKVGAGLELKITNHLKVTGNYDLHFLFNADAMVADSARVGICIGWPVKR